MKVCGIGGCVIGCMQYMGKTYQEWPHEVDLSYHMLGFRHALIQKGLQRRVEILYEAPTPQPKSIAHVPLGKQRHGSNHHRTHP